MAELLAVGAALCFATSSIAAKRGTRVGGATAGFIVGLLVTSLTVATVAVLTVERWSMDIGSTVLFASGGVVGMAVGRSLLVWGIRDVGASVAVPLQCSSSPLVATAAGVVVFHETVGIGRLGATALILTGIWLCARGGSANRADLQTVSRPLHSGRLVVLVPVVAGAAFAAGDILRKAALERDADPILGALIGTTTASVVWLTIAGLRRTREPLQWGTSLAWFGLYGLLTGAAQILAVLALQDGEISAISPILASQPVIVVLLSATLLRNVERLRTGVVLGAIVVFTGVAYISLT